MRRFAGLEALIGVLLLGIVVTGWNRGRAFPSPGTSSVCTIRLDCPDRVSAEGTKECEILDGFAAESLSAGLLGWTERLPASPAHLVVAYQSPGGLDGTAAPPTAELWLAEEPLDSESLDPAARVKPLSELLDHSSVLPAVPRQQPEDLGGGPMIGFSLFGDAAGDLALWQAATTNAVAQQAPPSEVSPPVAAQPLVELLPSIDEECPTFKLAEQAPDPTPMLASDPETIAPEAIAPEATAPPVPLVRPIAQPITPVVAAPDLGTPRDELPEWWLSRLADAQRPEAVVRSVGLSDLIDHAIAQSPRVRMLQRLPALADTLADRERAVFDPVWRLNTRYRDDQEPVGNQLLTGGPPVLKENTWNGTVGVQRRYSSGAVADVYQRLGFKNSNSVFFDPQDQGTATVGVDVTQPLLLGRGPEFNRAGIILAELQSQVSFYDYQAELQSEMVEIGTLYWQLLNARMIVLQVERSRQRAQQVLEILTARADYDASANQISLAKAEVSQRTTEWLEASQRVREFEISLRDKIADPDFAADYDVELLPAELAEEVFPLADLRLGDAIGRALAGRWELRRDQGRTQMADRQLFVSRCGLAPRLDLVLGVYANGLAGNSGVNRAWVNQFDTGSPGYYGGLEFELPQGRRSAKAEVQRDRLQKQQALDVYEATRNEIIAQVRTAHSRVATAIESRAAALATVLDMRAALNHLQIRWETTALIDGSAIDGLSPSLTLEQLLSGQRRLQDAEASLALADLQWALARQALLLAMGDILQTDVAPSEQAQ